MSATVIIGLIGMGIAAIALLSEGISEVRNTVKKIGDKNKSEDSHIAQKIKRKIHHNVR